MNEEIHSAEVALDKALAQLQKLAASGALVGIRQAAEIRYGQAYDRLVNLGVRPRLRNKYRGKRD